MRQVTARKNYLLLHEDGSIHYPFSKFLTDKFSNPNTRELVGQSLRILYQFCKAHDIEFAVRALEGRCLTYSEGKALAGLCYRPLREIELLSNKKIVLLTSAKVGRAPAELPCAVEPNTAMNRLHHIAAYLKFYFDVFLNPTIRPRTLRVELERAYKDSQNQLKEEVGGTKQGHHLNIQSLPSNKFLEIIRAIFLRPEELFQNTSGKPARTMYRERAMALLACEGLRPGTLGNIARADFHAESTHLRIKDHRDRRKQPASSTPLLKLGASTRVNSASETMIELWPFTVQAVSDYIDNERKGVLSKHLTNRSQGFLFLNEKGEPIKHRATITAMFKRLGNRLAALGLLDVGNDPYFKNQKRYDFYAYVLRHSSASYFLEQKGTDERAQDIMKIRYGWTKESKQPERYAARALSDQANIDLMGFNDRLMTEVQAKRQTKQDR